MRENFYTIDDVVENGLKENVEGKVLILHLNRLSANYQKPKYQLVRAIGGFGCKPDTIGTKVFVEFLEDGEHGTFRRGDFIGVAKDELYTREGDVLYGIN